MNSKYQRTIVIRKIERRLNSLPEDLEFAHEYKESVKSSFSKHNIYELEILLEQLDQLVKRFNALMSA